MLKASDIMTEEVATIAGSATVADAVKVMREKKIRSLIVRRRTEQDSYGILTETDIVYKVIAYGTDPTKVRVYEIMSKPCIAIDPDLGVEYVARLFANTKLHRAPVIRGDVLGIISISDILHRGDSIENPKAISLQQEIEKSIADAREICQEKGATSRECAVAWDIVEELEAEAAHQQVRKVDKTSFEEYCEENPSALEARMYDS
ncbi:CP12 domain-containing protein [Roseofilum casamattae]|uniref:CBS domain-containing protein n=1 Tax=Roseofilum casamattae BLCC-M143 TaxID=3022442 RepID=A0ABT7BXT7_9CYAN|nr:CP12 domain-containing protein [Roseofilum casamattae]MDJ1184003.1 CBS domain-containing protein [Roseofilum casamattae BLCC-M143]